MNRKKLIVTCAFLLTAGSLAAQDNKPQIRVGGLFFLHTQYDTYKSIDSQEGISYSYPLAPNLDAKGNDLNRMGQFSASVFATRLHVEASRFELLDAGARFYIETDFLGAGSSLPQIMRLRHAYLDLRWERDELLFGQTNNLEMPEEVGGGVLTSGAGSPITVLERPTMVRYGRSLGDRWKAYVAAAYHRSPMTNPTHAESAAAARNNGFPSAEARLQYASETLYAGIAGGFKSVMPRTVTADGLKTGKRFTSYSATAFMRLNIKGYRIRLQAIAGTDLTHLGLIGGYGKLLYPAAGETQDYGYTGLLSGSAWLDFETRSFNGFQAGIYAGYMENFGAEKSVDAGMLYARHADLTRTGRIAPRFTCTLNNLLLGVEYSLYFARWGKTFDERYRPISSFEETRNHRITLLVRYAF
jgi:hypothetical protein